MKKLLPIVFFCFSAIGFAQDDPYPQDVNKKHEVSMNALTLIVSEWIDLSYEYLINEESSFGIDVQFGLDNNNDFESYRNFSITPNYRRYFSNKYARGFYVEAFGMIHSTEEDIDIFLSSTNTYTVEVDKRTDFSLGISVGGKFVTKNGFVADVFLGVGRNLFNSENDFSEVAGRVGISLGYRF
ncbi:DUF3575 domain-containing protein [Pseudotenacibaculum haliotis]|uniref:DUF3575 domain-containing protein n=1 Tax=Pseudotenacibaculum haliotis TaxID=1862138 RepID=A0ABW5LZ63_9FLAO